MRWLNTKRFVRWWQTKNDEIEWPNKDLDCRLESLGKPLWDEIYAEHLSAYDTVRDLPRQLDRQMGIDCIALTPKGCRTVQEKVRTKNDYCDIAIESRKRDASDPLACADYCQAQYYSYAEYDEETKGFSRWIILNWPLLADSITPREILGTNDGGGGMYLYPVWHIVQDCPEAVVAQMGYL